MEDFQFLMRRALLKEFYKIVLSKPSLKQNKEYFKMLKPIIK